ncbi:MAG: hypothetical protein HY675_20050 [Chloroflexi bacterium]|nr:hypothetical protein [Chloroflexota bacterium]
MEIQLGYSRHVVELRLHNIGCYYNDVSVDDKTGNWFLGDADGQLKNTLKSTNSSLGVD